MSTDEATRIAFWRRMAAQFGGPVLVLACGTGHLAVAIEAMGVAVTGVESDAALLAHARLGAERADVHVRWVHGDARALALSRRFGLVILGDEWAAAAPTPADQQALLASVRRHLAPDGAFGFEAGVIDGSDAVDDLLEANGLAIVTQYGGWDFARVARGAARVITLCRLKPGA